VSFTREQLFERLAALEYQADRPPRYVIAFSGGLDSSVLAHALASADIPVLAVHIDHGLQTESEDWSRHCAAFAASLGIEFRDRKVTVELDSGKGPEASARDARYNALLAELDPGDWLLSAHHRNDQAETLLLNLMRGSGPAGLAGIGAATAFAAGWLVRPLIDVPRTELEAYAATHGLEWLDDPSNEDPRFDRNYLRHAVLPVLERRWPGVVERIARSADLAGEAATLLEELAAIDLRTLGDRPARIDVEGLVKLPQARQRNLLRHAIRRAGLPLPGAARLATVIDSVLQAKPDAQPLVEWPGGELRRYRGRLYLLPPLGEVAWPSQGAVLGATPVALGEGMGTLQLVPDAPRGLSAAMVRRGLCVRMRSGGEQLKPAGQAHTKKLKKLLQDEGVVPWMRERLPLVFAGDELVAVADLWVAAGASSEPGTTVRWDGRPELY